MNMKCRLVLIGLTRGKQKGVRLSGPFITDDVHACIGARCTRQNREVQHMSDYNERVVKDGCTVVTFSCSPFGPDGLQDFA